VSLSPVERLRYARHLLLPEVGPEGQERLSRARVTCVGAGGLGSPALLYLAAAGVGTLSVFDPDPLEETNLQRQVLFTTADLGRNKAEAAFARLAALNPYVRVAAQSVAITSQNALELLAGSDVIVDGTDSFAARYLLSDAAVLLKTPLVHASVFRFEGRATVFAPGGPCYRCLHPEPPEPGTIPSCAAAGVLGVLPGLLGCVQAAETLKLILGIGETLAGRLLVIDALRMRMSTVRFSRDPACAACGEHPTITAPVDYDLFCGGEPEVPGVGARELSDLLARGAPLHLLDVREPLEMRICPFPAARAVSFGNVVTEADRLRDRDVVVVCRNGERSERAVRLLAGAGIGARHLEGGLEAWRSEVDPELPRY
jgi:adenylyltransferase/sulfurtransferase